MTQIKDRVHNDFEELKINKEEYFNKFYNNNYNLVYRICFSILKDKENSEDVTQIIFEKIYKMPNEKLASEFESSWLYAVSKNEALQYIKKNSFNLPIDENINNIKNNQNEIEDIIENENYKRLVKNLNKRQQQIVSLKVVSDFTFKEISEILSIPIATVQWHYYKSIKSLKVAISNLAMFIITFICGLKFSKQRKSVDDFKEETINKKPSNSITSDFDFKSEESTSLDIQESVDSSIFNRYENVEQLQSTVADENRCQSTNISLGLYTISGIFLISAIIFSIIFVKNQQKGIKKSSKK